MAYGARNISPLDLRPSTAVGVSIPFSATNVFTPVYTTKDQLKYNIINFLLTDKRERLFQPNFGANLRSQVFEQITEEGAEIVKETLRAGIEMYFPNVNIKQLDVTPSADYNTINISFSYEITNTGQSDEILLNFENG